MEEFSTKLNNIITKAKSLISTDNLGILEIDLEKRIVKFICQTLDIDLTDMMDDESTNNYCFIEELSFDLLEIK